MGFRLLLVARKLQSQRVFKEAVTRVGAELLSLDDLEAAYHHLREEKFDVIFVETAVPGFGRQPFVRHTRESKFNSQAPIILLTGYSKIQTTKEDAAEGVSWITEPSQTSELQPLLGVLKRKLAAERRKHRRLPFRTDVNCLQAGHHIHATSIDLSDTGMLLEVSSRVRRETELEVRFLLSPDEPTLHCRAQVVRVNAPNRLGLLFQNLDSFQRTHLRRFLDAHLPPIK